MGSPRLQFLILTFLSFGTDLLNADVAAPFVVLLPAGKGAAALPACCTGPRILSCSLAAINPSALGTAAAGQLLLPNNIVASFVNLVPGSGGNGFHYTGPNGADVIITCSADRTACHGHAIVGAAGSFVLEYCGATSGHVWKQINVTGAAEAEGVPSPPSGSGTVRPDHDRLVRAAATENTTVATYSIKFYYTAAFAAVTPDIPGHVAQILAETNQGYANSKVPLVAGLCKIEAATINDVASSSTLIANFLAMKSSPAVLRDSADVAFLLVNSYDSCGIAYFDVLASGQTLATAMKSCSVGYYSSGHEICHNVGCSHDPTYAGATPYSYAYGHLIAPGGYRTIMAYPDPAYATRVNYYSNPSVILPATNTPTGLTTRNNAALLILYRLSLAAVGNEATCTSIVLPTTPPPTRTTPTTTRTSPTTTTITTPTTTRTSPTSTTTPKTTRTSPTTTTTPTTTRTSPTIATTRTSPTTKTITTPTTTRTSPTSTKTPTTTRTSPTTRTTPTTTRTSPTTTTTPSPAVTFSVPTTTVMNCNCARDL